MLFIFLENKYTRKKFYNNDIATAPGPTSLRMTAYRPVGQSVVTQKIQAHVGKFGIR